MTTTLMQPLHSGYPAHSPPSMLRMYPSSSTQQPAAQCLLRSPADAIHLLESVRLGLVPRVTRRLTGHERAMIRPGTVWVWEEEETNMRRWTDGRRWGASRVGGGGFLVYREVEGGGSGRNDSPSASPPPSSRNSPNAASKSANGGSPPARKAGLVKQTYSTSMAHPVTGRVKKFHVVAYSCKSDPGHQALLLPHQLPHLAYVKIMPGVWPDWEQRQDEGGSAKGKTTASAAQLQAPNGGPGPGRPSPSASTSYSGGPARSSGPAANNGQSPVSRSNTPQYHNYYPNPAPPPATPPLTADKDRYHPYRHNRPAGFPSSLAPSSASSPYTSQPPPPGMYSRDSRSPSGQPPHPQSTAPPYENHAHHPQPPAPYEHHWPPTNGQSQNPYSSERYYDDRPSVSRGPLPPPVPGRSYFDRERDERERGREREREHEPVVTINSPSPHEEAPVRSSYAAPYSHPSISAARDSHSRPGSPSLPALDRNRIGIAGIMNDGASSANGSSGITLPPLRLALDGREPAPHPPSPGSGSEDANGSAGSGRKWGEDQRQLNQLGRMVGL